jgi:rhodanese-related sulfurtransferase
MFSTIKNLFKTNYQNLSGNDFKQLYKETPHAVLIDVRTTSEIAQGAIKGHVHIDIMAPSFSQKINTLDKDKAYFIYCRSGNRSAQACNYMHQQGFTKLYNLSGGYMAYPK